MERHIIYISAVTKYTSYIEKFIYRVVTLSEYTDLKYKAVNEYTQVIKTISPIIEKDLGIIIDDLYLCFRHNNKIFSGLNLHSFIVYILNKFGEKTEEISKDEIDKCKALEEFIGRIDLNLELGFSFQMDEMKYLDIRKKAANKYGAIK